MIRRTKILLWVYVCLWVASCNSGVSQNVSNKTAPQNKPHIPNIVDVDSNMVAKSSSLWKASTYTVGSKESLQVLYFGDSNNGWTASYEGSLYKTVNSGKTWQKVNINVAQGAYISSIFFANPMLGWIAVRKTAPNILDYEANQAWIMKTSDGGQSWTTQHTEKAIGLSRIIFVDGNEGWAAGIKTIGLSPLRQVHYVLHTVNQGANWIDVSEGLNRIAANEYGSVQDQATDLYTTSPSRVTLLSLRGKIFNTDDGGKTWRNIVNIPGEPGQTCICRLGRFNNGGLWVSGGAESREGTWGMIAKEENNKTWTRYRTTGIYFRDAFYISELKVIASGSASPDKLPGGKNKQEGIMLYSSDGGRIWENIYIAPEAQNIHALHIVDSESIWAVGDNGLIVRLEATKDSNAQ